MYTIIRSIAHHRNYLAQAMGMNPLFLTYFIVYFIINTKSSFDFMPKLETNFPKTDSIGQILEHPLNRLMVCLNVLTNFVFFST